MIDQDGETDRASIRFSTAEVLTANTAGAHAQTHARVSITDDGQVLRLSSEDSSRVTGPGVACQDGSDLRGSQAILCAHVCQERSPDCQVRRA
ncbi:hypothetical protein QQF64_018122 [Cirrhinus molitorella]|uniref:FHA domain-containing protein n=1 Tax=Cirrhinus molitorella TaxID=172907 RepID=A0ABR3LKL2_9TELE